MVVRLVLSNIGSVEIMKSLKYGVFAVGMLVAAGAQAVTIPGDGTVTSFNAGESLTAVGVVDDCAYTCTYSVQAAQAAKLTLGTFAVDQSLATLPVFLTYTFRGVTSSALPTDYTNAAGSITWLLPDLTLAAGEILTFSYTFTGLSGGDSDYQLGYNTAAVPVPAAGLLLVGGIGALAAARRRKQAA